MGKQTENLWHTSASPAFSAPALSGKITADLAVIGGGFTGCAAALEAAEMGADVCLLEAQSIGYGGAGRNVGLVNAGLWLPPEDVQATLGENPGRKLNTTLAAAPDMVFSLIEKHQIECEATRAGTLHLAHARSGVPDLENRHRQLHALGMPVELLSQAETAQRTGSSTFHAALFNPNAGTIQPLSYVRGLAQAATQAGAQMYEHSPALSIQNAGGVWQIETPNGTLTAKALLRATNGYDFGPSGLVRGQYVPVNFFQIATKPLPHALRQTILSGGEGCWDTGRVMSSYRIDQAGRLILGAIGDLCLPGRKIHRDWATRKLAKVFPKAKGMALEFAWDGRIAMTSDHIPKILQQGENALTCLGYSGRGIGPGTLFGTLAARALLTGNIEDLPIAPIVNFREKMPGLRHAYYETGATLTHLIDARL